MRTCTVEELEPEYSQAVRAGGEGWSEKEERKRCNGGGREEGRDERRRKRLNGDGRRA